MEDKYPSYCDGPLFILSIPAIETLNMLFVQKFKDHFLWIEDLYLTGTYLSTYVCKQLSTYILDMS